MAVLALLIVVAAVRQLVLDDPAPTESATLAVEEVKEGFPLPVLSYKIEF